MARIKKQAEISKKMKFKQPKRNNTFVPQNDIIKLNEFFDVTFGGEPIPIRKMARNIKRIRNNPGIDDKILYDEENEPKIKPNLPEDANCCTP